MKKNLLLVLLLCLLLMPICIFAKAGDGAGKEYISKNFEESLKEEKITPEERKKLEMENFFCDLQNFVCSIKNEWDRILKNRLKTVEGFFLFRFGKRRKDKVRLLLY